MEIQKLQDALAQKHAKVLDLAAKRHAKKKEMVAARHGVRWGNSIGFADLPHKCSVVFDDMKESPFINECIMFDTNSCDDFIIRKVLKGGKPSKNVSNAYSIKEITGTVNSDMPNPAPASREELKKICADLNAIHAELIAAAKERLKAWEALFQAENNLTFGKSIIQNGGNEYLILGFEIPEYVSTQKSYKLIVAQVLKNGKISDKSKTIFPNEYEEVRRLP